MPTIQVKVSDPKGWLTGKRFRENISRISPIMRRAHEDAGLAVQEQVMMNLTDKYLHVQGNRLRPSFNIEVLERGDSFRTIIGSPLPYARIHDVGGIIPGHDIVARRAKSLRFKIGDQIIFRKRVTLPDIKMPRRPYFTDAFGQAEDVVVGVFSNAMEEIMRDLI